MKKKSLWFLTLISLILILGVYYITMPTDLMGNGELEVINEVDDGADNNSPLNITSLAVLRTSLDDERKEIMDSLQEQLTNSVLSSEEKNVAFEKIKNINLTKAKEEKIEKSIYDEYGVSCFTKVDDFNVNVICVSINHNTTLANNIMRLVQSNFKEKVYTTVKFQEV